MHRPGRIGCDIGSGEALGDDSDIASDSAGAMHFESAVQKRVARGLLTAARLKDAEGTIVYSPVPGEIGTSRSLPPMSRPRSMAA